MARLRVHELARELGISSKEALAHLAHMGEFVKSPSSRLAEITAQRLRESVGVEEEKRPSARSRTLRPSAEVTPLPHAKTPGWRAGAIPAPTHPDLLANIDRVSRKFVVFQSHLSAFKRLGSQVVFATIIREGPLRGYARAHVRFSGAIENGFGFTREVALFYSPHEDLQNRSFKAALRELESSDHSVTPDIFFMWAPDQRLKIKLQDWSRPKQMAIPLTINDEDELSLITLLRDYVYTRDLFYMTTPVHGANFFGRRTLLQALREDTFNQEVTGVFGLRKSGKTSILMQLREELSESEVVTVLLDLESFPSPPDDPTEEILSTLRVQLITELKAHGLRTKELSELGSRPSILELKGALHKILRKLSEDGKRVLILLDEIEYLTPTDKVDVEEADIPRISQFLSSLRSLVQETDNFNFALSGLTSAIIEQGRLYGRPNPLFSWAKAKHVTPFTREEADDLALTVGAKMGVQIEEGALRTLHEASGGHAFLYRTLASSVIEDLPRDDFQRRMTASSVLKQLDDWKSRMRGHIEEMVNHVSRYYDEESIMLELLMNEPADFPELASTAPVAIRRLKDLGLIYESGGQFEVSVVLELINE